MKTFSLPRLAGAIAAILFSFTCLPAAERPGGSARAEEQRAAMEKLRPMVGEWQGTGWILGPEGRAEFTGGEIVQSKLDGLALLVEGAFFREEAGRKIPTHTTLGVITFDPASNAYRFKSWLATGTTGERELKLIDQGWEWEIKNPQGTIRYRATFSHDEWFEFGERSRDGSSWQKFFEMRLKRTGAKR